MVLFTGLLGHGIVSPAHAGTTTAEFLKWERKSQDAFLKNSISMVGVIASQTKPEIARCLDDWYFKNRELAQKRNDEILNIMPQYRDFKPQAVLLALLENACGRFGRE